MTRPSRLTKKKLQSAERTLLARQQQLDKLAARFVVLREQLERDAVETMREMGGILLQAKQLAPRGFGAWIEEHLGVSRSAANNYRRVFDMSQTTPDVFVKWKQLGPSKVIRLARVEPQKRKTALKKRFGKKDAHQMTDAEFAQVVKPLLKKRTVSANMRAHGLHMKLRAVVDTLVAAKVLRRADNPELRKKLRADLADIVRTARELQKRVG